jgi:phosphoenolpyruvate carboxykinase (ATP)
MATQTKPHDDAGLKGKVGLAAQGLAPKGDVHWNLVAPELIETAIRRGEGQLADMGPFCAVTSPHTGRSPNDKFVVKEPASQADVDWGKVNQPFTDEHFETLLADVRGYLNARDELFVQDLYCGADPKYRLSVRYVSPSAWHMAFVRNMFIRPEATELPTFDPNFTVLHAPEFEADPAKHGTRTTTFIVLNLAKRMILIGGTRYAGELKKAMFTVMNYYMPKQGVLSMHCSANIGEGGDIFNYEGGCYAKVIHLSPEGEPDIYRTTQMFGTILENVVLDDHTRKVKFEDQSITENTRASYPLHYIPNFVKSGRGGHPKNIVFLTADAFGVLPPIAKLTRDQAMYYFLSGYTAKVAGTERGVKEPQATFSSCFGAVFLVWHPTKYAEMLGRLIDEHGSDVWLVNTGWTGGAFGVGKRMKLSHTRSMVRSLLRGDLHSAPLDKDPIFGLEVPQHVANVPDDVLNPRNTWPDKNGYDEQAKKLAGMFRENFSKFEKHVSDAVKAAGPRG